MKKTIKSVLAAGLSALLLGALPQGCTADDPTELVVGISTQVEVPRQLATVRLDVTAGGSLVFCQSYPVYNGRVQLPRTLGLTKDQVNVPITVAIYGFIQPVESLTIDCGSAPKIIGPDDPAFNTGTNPSTVARVLRRSTQPYIDGRILFIPMPLKYACFDVDCAENETCRAGECKPAEIDPNTLSTYRADYAYGDTSTCFRVKDCMYGAGLDGSGVGGPPELQDPALCRYKVPGAGPGMNVMIAYDEFVTEILDLDPEEGYFFPNPGDTTVIQLAPGLCQGKPKHKILSIAASRTCPPKSPLQPICDNGDIPLTPAKSGAYVIIDPQVGTPPSADSTGWSDLKKNLKTVLQMPIFSNSDISLSVLPAGACPSTFPAFGGAADIKLDDILASVPSGQGPASIPGSLAALQQKLLTQPIPGTSVKAVVIITRGDVEAVNGCPTPGGKTSKQIVTELAAQGIRTYVILSEKNVAQYASVPAALENAKQLAIAGQTFSTGTEIQIGDAYAAAAVNDMASCVYLKPSHITDTVQATLTHVSLPPFAPALPAIIPANGCSNSNRGGDGWGIDGDKIFVCGKYCDSIKNTNSVNAFVYGSKTDITKYITPLSVVWASQPIPKAP